MIPLHAEIEAIVTTVAGSTTHRAGEVAVFLAQRLQAQAGRAEGARDSRRKASTRARSAIRQAAGRQPMADGQTLALLPLQWPGWPGAIAGRIALNPKRFGVRHAPCDDVIRNEWALLKIEATKEV